MKMVESLTERLRRLDEMREHNAACATRQVRLAAARKAAKRQRQAEAAVARSLTYIQRKALLDSAILVGEGAA